jgi:glycosyltransferase involved in cell wall biosynthesis
MLRLNLSKTLKRADCVITVSEFSKNEIMNYFEYPEHRIRVVYNGIDLKRYRPDITPEDISRVCETYNLPNEYILYLGTLEPRKNIERLIEAYAIAKQGHSLPTLVLAGRKGWLYDGIFAKYKESGMSDGIVFTDYIAEENKPAILAGAKFFVFPSLYEGFGLPPLEAMACGTPAIVSSAGSLPEVCGDAAVYVEPFEVNCIAGALLQVNSDDELRARIREKGLARARLFDWNRLAEQLFEIYKEVMAS